MIRRWIGRVARTIWMILRDPARRRRCCRYIRRGCWVTLLLMLLLSCLSCVLLGLLVRRATAHGPEAGFDVLLVVDNSNSMFDKGGIGSDPELRRIEAAQMFINYLGVDSGLVSHKLGVIFFGGEARLVVPLTPLADQARRAEMASLIADPQRMDWTNPAAALALARDTLLAEAGGDRRPVVVLLTDGKPEWSNDPTGSERQSTIDALRRIGQHYADDGIRLFVILLANEATDADPEIGATYVPLWQGMTAATGGDFHPVRRADDLIAVYHDVLVNLSGVQTAGAVVEVEIEDETRVEVVDIEPNLERVTFVVRVSHPDVTVAIHRPDGQGLRAGDPDVRHVAQGTTAIWAITRPQPGDWAVVMAGQGSVTVWKDYLPAPATPTPVLTSTSTPSPVATATPSPTPAPELVVDEWADAVLAGQPLTLGVTLRPAPVGGLAVWADWGLGGEQSMRARLLDDGREGDGQAGDGHYTTLLTPAGPGILLVRVWCDAGGRQVASWEGRLRVEAYPELEIVAPQPGAAWRAGDSGVVQARWAVGGEPLAAGGWLTATLSSSDGTAHAVATGGVGESIALRAPQAAGTYTITATAVGRTHSALTFREEAVTTVEVRRPLPGWVWPVIVGLCVAGVGGWRLHLKFKRRPRVEGRLRVLEAPADYVGPILADLSLLNRRSVRLGGEKAELPLPADGEPWAIIRALPDGSGMELVPCSGQGIRVNDHDIADPYLLADRDCVAIDGARLRYEHLYCGL